MSLWHGIANILYKKPSCLSENIENVYENWIIIHKITSSISLPFNMILSISSSDVLCSASVVVYLSGAQITVRSLSSRFVFLFYWLTVIITLATYVGNLTASLAVRKVKMPFTTLHELARMDQYILTIRAGSIRETLFEVSNITYNKMTRRAKSVCVIHARTPGTYLTWVVCVLYPIIVDNMTRFVRGVELVRGTDRMSPSYTFECKPFKCQTHGIT
jgi:hypothetical protein